MTNYNLENKTVSEAHRKHTPHSTHVKQEILRKNRTFFTKSKILEKVVKRVQDDKKPHFTHFTHVKNAAFTLAEVLITLGIIGIVAAMTIPTLVSKIQEAHFHAKWKECYAILNNAFKMTVAENPHMILSDVNDRTRDTQLKRAFYDAILSHLNVIETCGYNNYDENLCDNYSNYKDSQIKYKWSGVATGPNSTKYITLSGDELNNYDFQWKAALLKNGASIYFGASHSGITILVDVNNCNGRPNVVGKDVYGISLDNASYAPKYIEDLYFLSHGAPGARCTDGGRCGLIKPDAGFGVNGCSEDIGAAKANYFVEASGAGCSYKYLYEK